MTMRILRNSELVEDEWTLIEDGRADIEAGPGKVIVTLARWRVEREALLRGHAAVAVLVRKRLGFRGELRAVGDVIRDLVFWLGRCGFDSIVPRKDQSLEGCREALREFTVAYQAAADEHTPVWVRRRRGGAAALH